MIEYFTEPGVRHRAMGWIGWPNRLGLLLLFLVVALQFFEELRLGFHYIWPFSAAVGAEPLAFWF